MTAITFPVSGETAMCWHLQSFTNFLCYVSQRLDLSQQKIKGVIKKVSGFIYTLREAN